jgi:hypothetical protein
MIVDEGDHGFERRSSSAIAKYADAFRRISLAWRSSRRSAAAPIASSTRMTVRSGSVIVSERSGPFYR